MNAAQLLAQRIQNLNLIQITENLLNEDEEYLIELQKDQLYSGLDNEGNSLRPSYLDDPYFKKFKNPQKAAQQYSDWKDGMNQRTQNPLFPSRPKGTPNLIISGAWFYDTLIAETKDGGVIIRSDGWLAPVLKGKYGKTLLGLSHKALKFYIDTKLFPRLKEAVYDQLSV